MPLPDLSSTLVNLQAVLDCPEVIALPETIPAKIRLTRTTDLRNRLVTAEPLEFTGEDFRPLLEGDLQEYRWDELAHPLNTVGVGGLASGDVAAPDIVAPGGTGHASPETGVWHVGPNKPQPPAHGDAIIVGALTPPNLAPSWPRLPAQPCIGTECLPVVDTYKYLTLAQVTRDLNRLVEDGHISSEQREFVLARRMKGNFDPCRTAKPPRSQSVKPNSVAQDWSAAVQAFSTAPFASGIPSERLDQMLPKLRDLTLMTQSQARFSNHTGLVHTLRGQLPVDTAGGLRQAAEGFVIENSDALLGAKLTAADFRAEDAFGGAVRLQQEADHLPVYGGVMVAAFRRDSKMTYLNSSFYAIQEDRSFENRFQFEWPIAAQVAIEWVRRVLVQEATQGGSPAIAGHAVPGQMPLDSSGEPGPSLVPWPGDGSSEGKVIFPILIATDDGETTPDYRPAWTVTVVERSSLRAWTVMVDGEFAEGASIERESIIEVSGKHLRVLAASENIRHMQAEAYLTVAHALMAVTRMTEVPTDPSASADIRDDGFQFRVAQGSGDARASLADSGERLRYGNAYFHLNEARKRFQDIIDYAWSEQDPANRPAVPGGPGKLMRIRFEPGSVGSAFGWTKDPDSGGEVLLLRLGQGGTVANHPPISDPVLDPDVLYHEYAHAILHIVQRDLQLLSRTEFHGAISEGLAFYFARSLGEQIGEDLKESGVDDSSVEHERWAQKSHSQGLWKTGKVRYLARGQGAQAHDFDYLRAYGIFPAYPPDLQSKDPDGREYACGMLLARTLWDIRRVLGPKLADAIILRAVHLAGGVQSELETLAEAIIEVDDNLATKLNMPSHANALQLIFTSRGILADSPINELIAVPVDDSDLTKVLLLAGTESASHAGGSNCLCSSDQGETWASLGEGLGMTGDVVALAALKARVPGTQGVIVWAATEVWTGQEGAQAAANLIYQCNLEVEPIGTPRIVKGWSAVTSLLPGGVAAAIRSMAATYDANGRPWLFVGTEEEQGIHAFVFGSNDSQGWPDPATPEVRSWDVQTGSVFSLAVVEADGSQKLLAGTKQGPRIWAIDDAGALTTLVEDGAFKAQLPGTVFAALTATAATDASGHRHIWFGTQNRGLYDWDATQKALTSPLLINRRLGQDGRVANRIHASWDAAHSGWKLAVGTDNGMYLRSFDTGFRWSTWNTASSPQDEILDNTAVVAICQAGSNLLIGTGQRGIWRQTAANTWERVAQGPSRLGRAADVQPGGTVTAKLPSEGVGTHILEAVQDGGSLVLTIEQGASALKSLDLFFVTSRIDLASPDPDRLAGLRAKELVPEAGSAEYRMAGAVKRGFYLIVVAAQKGQTADYRLKITVA